MALFLAVWLFFGWVQLRRAPRFCRVRPVQGAESVFFPLDP